MRQWWTRHEGVSPRDQAFDELTRAAGGGSRLSRRQIFRAAAVVTGVGAAGSLIEIRPAAAQSPGTCTFDNFDKCVTAAVTDATNTFRNCLKTCRTAGINKAHCNAE